VHVPTLSLCLLFCTRSFSITDKLLSASYLVSKSNFLLKLYFCWCSIMQDYIKESDNLVSLHDQIRDCDIILSQMESLLSGFQVCDNLHEAIPDYLRYASMETCKWTNELLHVDLPASPLWQPPISPIHWVHEIVHYKFNFARTSLPFCQLVTAVECCEGDVPFLTDSWARLGRTAMDSRPQSLDLMEISFAAFYFLTRIIIYILALEG